MYFNMSYNALGGDFPLEFESAYNTALGVGVPVMATGPTYIGPSTPATGLDFGHNPFNCPVQNTPVNSNVGALYSTIVLWCTAMCPNTTICSEKLDIGLTVPYDYTCYMNGQCTCSVLSKLFGCVDGIICDTGFIGRQCMYDVTQPIATLTDHVVYYMVNSSAEANMTYNHGYVVLTASMFLPYYLDNEYLAYCNDSDVTNTQETGCVQNPTFVYPIDSTFYATICNASNTNSTFLVSLKPVIGSLDPADFLPDYWMSTANAIWTLPKSAMCITYEVPTGNSSSVSNAAGDEVTIFFDNENGECLTGAHYVSFFTSSGDLVFSAAYKNSNVISVTQELVELNGFAGETVLTFDALCTSFCFTNGRKRYGGIGDQFIISGTINVKSGGGGGVSGPTPTPTTTAVSTATNQNTILMATIIPVVGLIIIGGIIVACIMNRIQSDL
jgi:hypothetical protein